MYKKLKAEIIEIIEIVNQCPIALQEKCFELLLKNYLNLYENDNPIVESAKKNIISEKELEQNGKLSLKADEEIVEKDFHVKVKRFLQSNKITMDIVNTLYYKEDEKLLPLYESLKSTKMSECQIRLALLTAFENSFTDEEMRFKGEVVRSRCNLMKCYDSANFTKNFKIYSSLFENWQDKYEKTKDYILSTEGKKELAKVLIDLAEDN